MHTQLVAQRSLTHFLKNTISSYNYAKSRKMFFLLRLFHMLSYNIISTNMNNAFTVHPISAKRKFDLLKGSLRKHLRNLSETRTCSVF